MIAAALVMATLGVGYALARQGLRQTTDDSLRNQAISYGQSQIEFIRNAVANYDPSTNTLKDTYKTYNSPPPNGFCILNSGAAQDARAASDNFERCSQYTGRTGDIIVASPFSIKNNYDPASGVFTINIQWTPISTTRAATSNQQLNLYYKAL